MPTQFIAKGVRTMSDEEKESAGRLETMLRRDFKG